MKKGIIVSVIIVFVMIVIVVINGISFVTPTRIFSTKYYSDPRIAFEKEYTPSAFEENIEITQNLELYDIDEYNTLFFGVTKANDLIVCTMHKKNNKYYFAGYYVVYDLTEFKGNYTSTDHTTSLFNKNGKKTSNYKWLITSDSNEIDGSNYYKLNTIDINYSNIQLYLIIK